LTTDSTGNSLLRNVRQTVRKTSHNVAEDPNSQKDRCGQFKSRTSEFVIIFTIYLSIQNSGLHKRLWNFLLEVFPEHRITNQKFQIGCLHSHQWHFWQLQRKVHSLTRFKFRSF